MTSSDNFYVMTTLVGAYIEHSDFDEIESEPHEAVEVADKAMPSQPLALL
jgi:hypothetical protein